MILEAILVMTGLAATASVVNLFMKNKQYPRESISIKKNMDGGMPIIELNNGDNTFNFLIDTGSNVCHIGHTPYKKLINCVTNNINNETIGIGGNATQELSCIAPFVDIMGNNYDIEFLVSEGIESTLGALEVHTGTKIDGILGTDFLQNYKYTVDFKTLEIYTSK